MGGIMSEKGDLFLIYAQQREKDLKKLIGLLLELNNKSVLDMETFQKVINMINFIHDETLNEIHDLKNWEK
jgi:hypothetical protein